MAKRIKKTSALGREDYLALLKDPDNDIKA
jgi:hypothetical protein